MLKSLSDRPTLEGNPDHRLLTAPPTPEEMATYLRHVQPRRSAHRQAFDLLAELKQQADWYGRALWQKGMIEGCDEAGTLDLRRDYARILTQMGAGWIAREIAPEIGAEIAALEEAIQRLDDEHCFCLPPPGGEKYFTRTQVWSRKHTALVRLETCPQCGFTNARP